MTVASVHLADRSVRSALRSLRRPAGVAGLRQADTAVAVPLALAFPPLVMPSRVALVAFWDDHDALSAFLGSAAAQRFSSGWTARLEPVRAFGSWPGLGPEVPRARATPDHTGRSVVVTLGRLRLTQVRRFLRTSRAAESEAVRSPGFLWGTALARPPFVATVSLWDSTDALAAYAYGRPDGGHPTAIAVDRAKPFHHQSAFIRFRVMESNGELRGRNPLPASALAT